MAEELCGTLSQIYHTGLFFPPSFNRESRVRVHTEHRSVKQCNVRPASVPPLNLITSAECIVYLHRLLLRFSHFLCFYGSLHRHRSSNPFLLCRCKRRIGV